MKNSAQSGKSYAGNPLCNIMKPVFLCVAAVVAVMAFAATDRTITEPETLTANTSYGRLVVNSDLTVAAGVTLTCEQLCVATGETAVASLTLKAGAKVNVTKSTDSNGFGCVIGISGGRATLTLEDGAEFSGGTYMVFGYFVDKAESPTSVSVVLNGSAKLTGGTTTTYINRGATPTTYDKTVSYVTIALNDTSELSLPASLTKNNETKASLLFNGGHVLCAAKSGKAVAVNQTGRFVLESVAGNDIVFEFSQNGSTWFGNANNAYIDVIGTGALVKAGVGSSVLYADKYYSRVAINSEGGIVVREGALKLDDTGYSTTLLSQNGLVLAVHPGAEFDLNGQSVSFGSVTAGDAHSVANTASAPAEIVLTGDGDSSFIALDESIGVVKNGSGKMNLLKGSAAAITVNAGELVCGSRATIGYPYYKWHVTKAADNAMGNIRVGELRFYDGEDIVTTEGYSHYLQDTEGGYVYSTPFPLIDGDLTTLWDDRRLGNTSDERTNKCWVGYAYLPPHPVTGYTFSTAEKTTVTPYEWTMSGSDDAKEWTVLGMVTGFSSSKTYDWIGTDFPVAFPSENVTLSIARLHVTSGAKVTADAVDLSCGVLETFEGSEIKTVNGGVVLMGSDSDATVNYPTLSGDGTFAKIGSGTTTVCGGGTFAGLIEVRGGTLRFADMGSVGPWFQFSITANRDNANNNTVQLSEFALYDSTGVRVNMNMSFLATKKKAAELGAGEMTAITGTPGGNEAPDKATDGLTTTKGGLYVTTKPNPLTMRLIDNTHRVVSYALATANDHSERDPAGWELLASSDGENWMTIDKRPLVEVASDRNSWTSYNGGVPYAVTNLIATGRAAFSSSATVKVSGDAVLDLSLTTTTIGNLSVDYSAGGTISDFSAANNGVLTVSGLPDSWSGSLVLPIAVTDCVNPAAFETWKVVADGKLRKGWSVTVSNGFLSLRKSGLILVVQ